jgi:hypothetical protein
MDKIMGAIFPIPVDLVYRLFDGKTKVFVKYMAHNSTRLAMKNKIVFYASHGSKKLIGEGTIAKLEFLTPAGVLTKYKEFLFLSEEELQAYASRSLSRTPSKEMLTLTLDKIKRYPKPVDYDRPVTMAGQYLTQEEYNKLHVHS